MEPTPAPIGAATFTTTSPPVDTVELSLLSLGMNLDITDGSGETDEVALQTEALNEQAFAAYEGDAFVAAIQANESIGATVTGVIVVAAPTPAPTIPPTLKPTLPSTGNPTFAPVTAAPVTPSPTKAPITSYLTNTPTLSPTDMPSIMPTVGPTYEPTIPPVSPYPTNAPTSLPTDILSQSPSAMPSDAPNTPTLSPTAMPSVFPTVSSTNEQTILPVTPSPTKVPTFKPTIALTANDHSDDHTHTPTLDTPTRAPISAQTDGLTAAPTPDMHLNNLKEPTHALISASTEQPSSSPTTTAPTLPPTAGCISDIPCPEVPFGLVSCGILDEQEPCDPGSHCYGFPATPAQELCVPEISGSAYSMCDSNCDCLGINTFGNAYKYFVTTEYGNVYMLYFEKCTDCYNSVGDQQCAPSSYVDMGTHEVEGQDYGGCFSDPTPDNNKGGFFYAYNFLKDTQDCIPELQQKENYSCFWYCKKN